MIPPTCMPNATHRGLSLERDVQSFAQAVLSGGEGLQTEFKQVLPWAIDGRADKELERRALKTVAAFANGAGGTVINAFRMGGFTSPGNCRTHR